MVIIANTWQPLGAFQSVDTAAQRGPHLYLIIVLSRVAITIDMIAHRSSRISTGLGLPLHPGATPYATVKPSLDVGTIVRG